MINDAALAYRGVIPADRWHEPYMPRDELVYFWWAYLRAANFLAALPAGGGGTRPRLQADVLAATAVNVPDLEKRATVHNQLALCAARE